MQRLTLALFCAALALMSATVSANKDLMVGSRQHGDYLLEQQDVELRGFPFKVRDKTVALKGDGLAKITRVEIYDLKGEKHAATPSIVSGGPGYSFVSVNFVSHRGHGVHFLIKAYGRQ